MEPSIFLFWNVVLFRSPLLRIIVAFKKVEIKLCFLKNEIFQWTKKIIFGIISPSCRILKFLGFALIWAETRLEFPSSSHKGKVWSFRLHETLLQNYSVKPRESNQCIFQFSFHLNWVMTEAVPGHIEQNFRIIGLVKEELEIQTSPLLKRTTGTLLII